MNTTKTTSSAIKNETYNFQKFYWKHALILSGIFLLTSFLLSTSVYANDIDMNAGVTQFDTLVEFIAGWITRLGGLAAFFGVIAIGFGFATDNSQAKVSGMWFLVGGFIVAAASMGYTFFIGIGNE